MTFGASQAFEADVQFRASWAEFSGDMEQIRAAALRTYGALDEQTARSVIASEKYDRALARSKGSSYAVQRATQAYKAELASIEGTQNRVTAGATRHSGALKQEERSLQGMARGAVVGSGALGHLGRAAVFASSSVLGGYGLVFALRSVINAARDQQVAVAHLDVALTNSGVNYGRYRTQIRTALDEQIKLSGFTDHELTDSLAGFVRRFGDVNQALRANAIATNVARAQNISLAEAASLINRASFGNAKTLRTLQIELVKSTENMDALKASTKHASAEQIANAKAADQQATELSALDAIQAKYHGSSAKFLTTDAGKQALFNAELEHSKEIIGEGLLPTFNNLLIAGTAWLDQLNRTGKLQRDVNTVVKDGTDVVHGFKDAYDVVGPVLKTYIHLAGGVENVTVALLAVYSGAKMRRALLSLGLLKKETAAVGATAVVAEAETATAMTGIAASETEAGTAATIAGGKVAALRGSLFGLGLISIAPIVIPIEMKLFTNAFSGKVPKGILGGLEGALNFGPLAAGALYRAIAGSGTPRTATTKTVTHIVSVKGPGGASGYHYKPGGSGGSGGGGHGGGGGGGPLILGLSYAQQNQLLEAQATASTADDLAVLQEQVSFLDDALKQAGLTPQQRNELLSARDSALSQLQSIQQQASSATKAAASKATAARRRQLLALTKIPAALIAREAHAEASGASTAAILKLLGQEKKALHGQEGQLRSQGAGAEFDALIAKQEEAVQKHIQQVLKAARRKRIGALESVPVELRLAEATAKAHNASEERLLAIYKKEHAALEKQIAVLKKIGASKEEILKARQNEAAVQAKINAATKGATGDFAKLEREFLTGIENLAQDRGNVFAGSAPNSGLTVEVHQHFPHPPTTDGHREAIYARRAAQAAFDG